MAGAVPEALRAAKAGADIIIAQRTEGGGHVGWMVSMPLATVDSPGPAIRPPLARLAQRLRLIGPLCVPELQEPGIVTAKSFVVTRMGSPGSMCSAAATTPQEQRGGANLPVGTRVVNAVNFCR